MKRTREAGVATVWMVVIMCFAVVSAAATTYFVKKASDNARAEQSAQQQTTPTEKQAEVDTFTETPVTQQTKTEQQAPSSTCVLDATMYISVKEGHALRADKSLTAAKVTTAPYAAALTVGCKDGAWYKASYNGKEGYAYAEYLSSTKPAEAATSTMTQDKCLSVSSLYTTKDPTPVYVLKEGKAVSANQSVPKGTLVKGGECAMWQGKYVSGYWEYDATLYSFSDLSTTKP